MLLNVAVPKAKKTYIREVSFMFWPTSPPPSPELKGGLLLWSECSSALAPKPSYSVACTQLCHSLWVKGSHGSSFLLDRNWRSVLTSSLAADISSALSAELNICYETSDITVSIKPTPGPGKAKKLFAKHPFFLPASACRAFRLITHSQLESRFSAGAAVLPHRPTSWCH
jgi:hypothetical protein